MVIVKERKEGGHGLDPTVFLLVVFELSAQAATGNVMIWHGRHSTASNHRYPRETANAGSTSNASPSLLFPRKFLPQNSECP